MHKELQPLGDLLDVHIDENCGEAVAERVIQIEQNANQAFHDTKPETVVMAAAAIGQEPPSYIQSSLQELTKQMDDPKTAPFSIIISANYPSGYDAVLDKRRSTNISVIREFQQSSRGQRLPISFYEQEYDPRTTIGTIRRDLATLSLRHLQVQHQAAPPEHAGVVIFDVDTLKLSPAFMSRQQQVLRDGFSWICANVRYPTSGGAYPNLDRAIGALNLAHKLSPIGTYDAHSMYAARTLASGNSFLSIDDSGETHRMRWRAEKAMGSHFLAPDFTQVAGAFAVSSPRRIADKFRNGQPSYEFWGSDSFGMQDAYRVVTPPDEDISKEFADFSVAQSVASIVSQTRNGLVKYVWEEFSDQPMAVVRKAVDSHLLRILEIADNIYDLRLGEISLLQTLARPTVELTS